MAVKYDYVITAIEVSKDITKLTLDNLVDLCDLIKQGSTVQLRRLTKEFHKSREKLQALRKWIMAQLGLLEEFYKRKRA